jgi:hypothetical protein
MEKEKVDIKNIEFKEIKKSEPSENPVYEYELDTGLGDTTYIKNFLNNEYSTAMLNLITSGLTYLVCEKKVSNKIMVPLTFTSLFVTSRFAGIGYEIYSNNQAQRLNLINKFFRTHNFDDIKNTVNILSKAVQSMKKDKNFSNNIYITENEKIDFENFGKFVKDLIRKIGLNAGDLKESGIEKIVNFVDNGSIFSNDDNLNSTKEYIEALRKNVVFLKDKFDELSNLESFLDLFQKKVDFIEKGIKNYVEKPAEVFSEPTFLRNIVNIISGEV